MGFPMSPERFFEYQADLWIKGGLPAILGTTTARFVSFYIEPLREQLRRFDGQPWQMDERRLPFVLVFPERLAPLPFQLGLIRLGFRQGATEINLAQLRDRRRVCFDHRPYLALDVCFEDQNGDGPLHRVLDLSRPTAAEVLAAVILLPDLLNVLGVALTGSYHGVRETVPFLFKDLNSLAPRLCAGQWDKYSVPSDARYFAISVGQRV